MKSRTAIGPLKSRADKKYLADYDSDDFRPVDVRWRFSNFHFISGDLCRNLYFASAFVFSVVMEW